MSASTAQANEIYTYHVQVKDVVSPSTCEENVTYKIGDIVWVKTLCTICMFKFG